MLSTSASSHRLQLHCDQHGCRKKFIPRLPGLNPEDVRGRASVQGWATKFPGSSAVLDEVDLCPIHKAERDVALAQEGRGR